MTRPSIPVLWVLPLALTACTSLAPDYHAPALPVPQTLGATQPLVPAQAMAPDREAALRITEDGPMPWADFIQEPRLREVVALALDHNRDLRVALLAIERARAQYGIERSALFPAVNATGAGNRSRTADDLVTAGRPNVSGQYSAQLGFTGYEIDFFGRVRNLNEVALQEFLRVAENRRSVQLSLVAEVANAWLALRTRQQALDLTRQSHALGAASGLTLAQTQTTVDSARADVAAYVSQLAKDRNALALLAGTAVPDTLLPPGVADAMAPPAATGAGATPHLAPPAEPAAVLLAVPSDLPSSVLLRRPDVQAAEHQLQGTYANIGAARAAFFPSITLTASVGVASNQLSGLFDGGNGTWSFAPQIRLPIFDAGRNRANLRVAETAQGTAVAQYEKAVQTAFREVADALAERATLAERLDAQRSLVDATQRALELSDARYRLGADNYLTVLDAQRSLYAAQQAQISLHLAEQVNRITLYKVLGGHWADGTLLSEDVEGVADRG
jgi:NodT family efflux transporter outer membrane factor (OMF) lipoprotein